MNGSFTGPAGEAGHKTAIPGWLLENDSGVLPEKGGVNTGYLNKTIKAVSSVLQNDLLAERFAAGKGLLQGIDPRIRLLSVLFLMLAAGFSRTLPALFVLAAAAFLLSLLSRLETAAYIRRVWLLLPLIALIVSVPASTSLFIPGRVLLKLNDKGLYFSVEGAKAVLKMFLRVGISVSLGYSLVMTTRWSHLTRSLSILRVPPIFITVLDMTYRYIFVLSGLAVEMFDARKLRTVGRIDGGRSRSHIGAAIAFLFVKAGHMSDEIYDSMLCRCYCGEPAALREYKLKAGDFLWLFNILVITAVLILL